MVDFFLSYNHIDRIWAEWIGWQLEDAGFSVILDSWDFHPGSNFTLALKVAAEKAETTVDRNIINENYAA